MSEREKELQRRIDKALALASEWEAESERYGKYAEGSSVPLMHRTVQRNLKLNTVALRAALAADTPTTATAEGSDQ